MRKPNELLRNERLDRGWSQEQVAEMVGTGAVTISRWERGKTFPSAPYQRKLCLLFEKTPEELGLIKYSDESVLRPEALSGWMLGEQNQIDSSIEVGSMNISASLNMRESNERLRNERRDRGWSQEQVAEMVGTGAVNISRWENGSTFPSPYYRQKLCQLFEKTPGELGLVKASNESVFQWVTLPGWMLDEQNRVDSSNKPDFINIPVGFKPLHMLQGHTKTINRIAWSPDGRKIASPSTDQQIRIWDTDTGEMLHIFKGYKESVLCVAWSPNGQILASGYSDGTIILWDTITYETLEVFKVHSEGVSGMEWSPDGQLLASGAFDSTIQLWRLGSKRPVQTLHRHKSVVTGVAWSPNGRFLASSSNDEVVLLWEPATGKVLNRLAGHTEAAMWVTWTKDGKKIASGARDHTIRIWDANSGVATNVLEGHSEPVDFLSFSADGNLLASNDEAGVICLWRLDSWEPVATFKPSQRRNESNWTASIAFHPFLPILATLNQDNKSIRIWELDYEALLGAAPSNTIKYTSAKVVLVGESNVGKSCLAMRLAENRYPDDLEQGTTHGMRFWPIEPEKLSPSMRAPSGEYRDVVLWDMGGQDEYRLIHQLFLHDTTLALILMDPTRGRTAFEEVEAWNISLEKQLQRRKAIKLLVGSKMDSPSEIVHQAAIERLRKDLGFAEYYETSAKTGRGIEELRKAIAEALDWESLAKTSRPELFQRIREQVNALRNNGEVVVLLDELEDVIQRESSGTFESFAVSAAVEQLAVQGIIVVTQLTTGEHALVLQLPVIEEYAGSLILAARNNPRSVPALEERALAAPNLRLPAVKKRLPRYKELAILESVVELLIQHGICFRHEGLLIFPTLFPEIEADNGEKLPHSVSLYYDFTGAIDNIYASLVAWLVMSGEFGSQRLWANRAEFDEPGKGVCGIRQIKRKNGLARIDLFFAEETKQDRKAFFIRFVEDHLHRQGVEVREHQAIKCRGCGYEISEEIVQENIVRDQRDVICPKCRTLTLISEGVEMIRERDRESDQKIFALRTEIEKLTREDAQKAKQVIAIDAKKATARIEKPIRILHLSDLHFTAETTPDAKLQWLLDDIRKGESLGFETLDYLVISGDFTDRGKEKGFERAREFVSLLIQELSLSAQRCIFAPGNHDVQDQHESYDWRENVDGLKPEQWVQKEDIVLVRNETKYPFRLQKFSDAFFHKILQQPYPLECSQQGLAYLFPDTRIQFLTLNSCWQIDRFYRKRSGVHPDAVAHVIQEADKQVKEAIERNDLMKRAEILRFGVWHHAVAGPEMMQNRYFIEHLQNNAVKLCLHGDVHEIRRELIGYWHKEKKVYIIGAGSFGSPAEGRPESTPRLYNLLEVRRDLCSVRVHTRSQPKPDGPWKGWYEWPSPVGGEGMLPYYDIDLK